MAAFTKHSEHNVEFAKGGDTPMFGHQDAGPQEAACTSHDTSGSGGKYAEGGKGKMFAYSPSVTATAGKTSAR